MMDLLVMPPRPAVGGYSTRTSTISNASYADVGDGITIRRKREYSGNIAVNPSSAETTTSARTTNTSQPLLAPRVSTPPPITGVYFPVGTKVEYFSETMNGWVLSYVKGINSDGTYSLNTKKSAPVSRVRSLIPSAAPAMVPPRAATSGEFVSSLQFQNSADLSTYRNEILSLLGLRGAQYSISRMGGFTGGQNEGIYFVRSSSSSKPTVCLKIVRSGRLYDSVPSELENCVSNLSKFPTLPTDPHVTFPSKVIQLVQGTIRKYDVFVMPLARGERMAETVGRFANSMGSNKRKIESIFEAVGAQLERFHSVYKGAQHGDLQTSNIFLEEQEDKSWFVTFIDLGGMGAKVQTSDADYFRESIRLLARTYGAEFERVASNAFERGRGN